MLLIYAIVNRIRNPLRNKPVFNLLACPGCFAKEGEAGFHGRIELETPDWNTPSHFAPTVLLNKVIDDALQCNVVQGIARR